MNTIKDPNQTSESSPLINHDEQTLRRIDRKYIIDEISGVLFFNKGILYTVKELVLRPGQCIQTFLKEDRSRMVKPIIFLILCSLIYTVAQRLWHFEDGYVQTDITDSAVLSVFGWIQANYGYANLIVGVFIGFWTRLLFRKFGYNIYEVLILIFFTLGVGMLLYTVFGIAEVITGFRVLHLGSVFALIYTTWAIGNFFDKRKASSYFKSLFAYLLGSLSSMILAIAIGIFIDLVTK